MTLGRSLILLPCLAVLFAIQSPNPAASDDRVWHHALSLVSAPKYGPDFKHFDWVNPYAPKGGTVVTWDFGTFDTLNSFPPQSNPPLGLGFLYDSLMTGSLDEASTEYGLIAEGVSFPADFSSVTFRLRKEARFHDGEPVKPEDVIFSFEKVKEVSPQQAFYYKNVVKSEKTGDHEVTFTFDVKGNRELPQIMGQVTILPKHYWTGIGKDGKPRDLAKSTLEPPLGSGPYKIKNVDPGRSITYERVQDYWARDLPVSKGFWNFDAIKFDFYRDQTVAFEAFKSGRLDFYVESSAKNWATGYENFPAMKAGLAKKEKIVLKAPEPMQSWVLNLRKPMFQDPRVRRAFNLAFDFEWANKNLFYEQYVRTDSYFENQDELQASALPEGAELDMLTEIKDLVPPELFTAPYKNPLNPTPADFRTSLRDATRLLKEAGWSIVNNALTNDKTGKTMEVEFLLQDPSFERVVLPYIKNLERLGIKARVRQIDSSQYVRRVEEFDFDVVTASFAQSESPGNEQRDFWGSAAAGATGSRNLIGIKDPAVDKLIDKIIFAKDRAELVAATRALDRVLLWNNYVVPQWHVPFERIAYWDKIRRPEKGPSRGTGLPSIWWYDAAAAAKVEPAQKR